METFLRDARFGLRLMARNPGFAAVAVLTLSLGMSEGPFARMRKSNRSFEALGRMFYRRVSFSRNGESERRLDHGRYP